MKEWVAQGHSPGFGFPHKSVKAQWQPWRVEARQHDQETCIRALRYLVLEIESLHSLHVRTVICSAVKGSMICCIAHICHLMSVQNDQIKLLDH